MVGLADLRVRVLPDAAEHAWHLFELPADPEAAPIALGLPLDRDRIHSVLSGLDQGLTSNCSTADPISRSALPALRASAQKYLRPNATRSPSAVVTPSHAKLGSVRQPRKGIPLATNRNSIGGRPPSAAAVNVYTSPTRTAEPGKLLVSVSLVTSPVVSGFSGAGVGAAGADPHESVHVHPSNAAAYGIVLRPVQMIHSTLPRTARFALLCLATAVTGCGGGPSTASPISPSPVPPVAAPTPLVALETGNAKAEFLIATNAPGKIRYSLGFSIHLPPELYTRLVTIRRFELWLIGADGTVHDNRVFGSFEGQRFGGEGPTRTIGMNGSLVTPDDPDNNRAAAALYRMSLEYVVDDGPQSSVVNAESPIVSTVPPPPRMTGLTISGAQPPPSPPLHLSTPVTLSATGAGGRQPYEYQWSAGNVVVRDWSNDPRVVWDGLLNGIIQANMTITVRARSAGGSAAEVRNEVNVFLN